MSGLPTGTHKRVPASAPRSHTQHDNNLFVQSPSIDVNYVKLYYPPHPENGRKRKRKPNRTVTVHMNENNTTATTLSSSAITRRSREKQGETEQEQEQEPAQDAYIYKRIIITRIDVGCGEVGIMGGGWWTLNTLKKTRGC